VENEELAIQQAERFEQMLIKKLQIPKENILFYPDAVNTHIKLAIARLQKTLPAKSNLIFYYRGKTFIDSSSGKLYLVPVDVSNEEIFYMFDVEDLCTRLNTINRTGVSIFIDARPGEKSGKSCILDNGFKEEKVPLKSVQNMSLFTLKPALVITEKANVPVNVVKPEIFINEPSLKTTETKESSVIINGKVKSACKIDVISVNGQEAHSFIDGSFVARVALEDGENVIAIEAKNCAGWTRDYLTFIKASAETDMVDLADSAAYSETGILKEQGKNFAVIIGVSKYRDATMPDLYYPIFDARKVKEVLIGNYTFDVKNVFLLENPLKGGIMRTLDSLNGIITNKDNLLIFYAGHGTWDEKTSMGYWLPSDAAAKVLDNWIMNSIITGYASQSKARHTLVIADACFAGSIFRTRAFKTEEEKTVSDLYLKTSKKAMTSGDLTEVPDVSIFVKNFILVLSENKESYLPSQQLFFGIKPKVVDSADLIPQFGIIKNAGDQGGDFIFFKK
jgi:hypothetical protein